LMEHRFAILTMVQRNNSYLSFFLCIPAFYFPVIEIHIYSPVCTGLVQGFAIFDGNIL